MSIVGYVDVDYARNLDDKRLTTGYVFTLVGGPICWRFMIQSTVVMSATKTEDMAAVEVTNEDLWLIGLVRELGNQ